jgi:hypothetical protein
VEEEAEVSGFFELTLVVDDIDVEEEEEEEEAEEEETGR